MPWKTEEQMRRTAVRKVLIMTAVLFAVLTLVTALAENTPRQFLTGYAESVRALTQDIRRVAEHNQEAKKLTPTTHGKTKPVPSTTRILTIRWLAPDGRPMVDDYTRQMEPGQRYQYASYVPSNFTVDREVIEGVMPDEDLTIEVHYSYKQ